MLDSHHFVFLALIVLFFTVTPLFEIDEKNDRFAFFNDFIVIDGKAGLILIDGNIANVEDSPHAMSGEQDLTQFPTKELKLIVANGNITVDTTETSKITWDCKLGLEVDDNLVNFNNEILELDLSFSPNSYCKLQVPEAIKLNIIASEGRYIFRAPRYDLDLSFKHAIVRVQPDPAERYNFDFILPKGTIDTFVSSRASSAWQIKIEGYSGKIVSY
jgi:hypothetical protein